MFSMFNQTTRSKSHTIKDLRKSSSLEKILPSQRRDKLKDLLLVKFMKKYELQDTDQVLEEEVKNFLKREKLTDKDLKKFDNHLGQMILEKKTAQNLRQNLTLNNTSKNDNNLNQGRGAQFPEINDNMSVISKHSKMSGISKLSNFSDMNDMKRAAKKASYQEFKEESDQYNQKTMNNTIDLVGDNWNAINKYNQKMFEDEKREAKIKDKELKRRLKDDLDVQMREKVLRNNEELIRNKEFDKVILQHVDNLNNLEKEKELEIKRKILKEKECRDRQLKDDVKRKKIEVLKNKKFEKNLGK